MINNINAVNNYGISVSVGEYDTIKEKLRLYYSKSRMKKLDEIEVYDVEIPEGAKNVELVDLDTDVRYIAEVEDFKNADKLDGKVTIKIEGLTKIR